MARTDISTHCPSVARPDHPRARLRRAALHPGPLACLASGKPNYFSYISILTAVGSDIVPNVELIQLRDFPGALAGRQFDYIVAMDLLDRSTSSELLELVHELLTPGGEILFYESNPWNPMHKLRGSLLKLLGKRDPRNLIDRPGLYELLSEIGFIRIYAVFNDFVFAPLTRPLIWLLRNVSILLENVPLLRTMAGSILVHAQKPPRFKHSTQTSLFAHEALRECRLSCNPVSRRRNEHSPARRANARLLWRVRS